MAASRPLIAAGLAAWLSAVTGAALPAQKTPDEALRALQAGNQRFAAGKSVPQPVGEGVRRTLARGESPFALVVCCTDSRVPPEHVFNAGLGELHVVRVAGNGCDAETIASIEYAVDRLNVSLCVVLGHEGCATIAGALAQVEAPDAAEPAASQALQQLLEQAEPAVRKARDRGLGAQELLAACEEEHAHRTVHECLRKSPLLRRFAQVGRFRMVAARYHLQSGAVEWLPNRPLPAEPATAAAARPLTTAPTNVPPHVALRLLQAGLRRFLSDGLPAGDLTPARREELTHGQQPIAIVLTCADSRVSPDHLFDTGLGELCVVRVAGNTLNDDTLASIEHAACHTGASLLVVLGHTRCGAIAAAADTPSRQSLTPSLRALVTRLEPSVEQARRSGETGEALVELAARLNVQRVLAESRTRSAILRQLEQRGNFAMLPAIYDVTTGDVTWLRDSADPIAAASPPAAPHGEMRATSEPAQPAAPAADHGSDAAGDEHRDQREPGAAHGAHAPAAAAGSTAPTGHGHHLPVVDWGDADADHAAAPPATTGHGAEAHGAHPPHGAPDAHDPHGGHAVPDLPPTAAAPAHEGARVPWTDPIVLVGLGGVASLLLAAMIALVRRR
jgi:carbonic anhydrase